MHHSDRDYPKRKAVGGNPAAIRKTQTNHSNNIIDFKAINNAAILRLPTLLLQLLPNGKCIGHEWVACNPRRADCNAGSFKINVQTGRWADFATGEGGGDVISLAAYLGRINQIEAARQIAAMLGMEL